jgi:transcription antitermination protein NusB
MTDVAALANTAGLGRRQARLAAIQALYQMDLAQTGIDQVISEFLAFRFGTDAEDPATANADAQHFERLVRAAVERQREIDPLLDQQLAAGWRLKRVDAIVRAILRAGVTELIDRSDVPPRVVISEFVDVANAFFEGDEPKVVNAVLDKLARRLRPDAFNTPPAA